MGLDPGEADAVGGQQGDQVGDPAEVVELELGHAVATVGDDPVGVLQAVEHLGLLGVHVDHDARPVLVGQVLRRARDQVGAVLEDDDLVGQALGLQQEVGAHDDGVAVLGHRPDELQHGVGGLGVEAGRGLVVEQQVGVVHDRAGQGQPGLHAGRIAPDHLLQGGLDAEAGGGLTQALLVVPQAVELGGVGQVVPAVQPVVEGRLGRDDAAATADVLALVAGVDPERPDLTPVGVQRAGDHADGGGLARPVGPEQDRDLALGHRQVEVGQRIDLAEASTERASSYEGSIHAPPIGRSTLTREHPRESEARDLTSYRCSCWVWTRG